MLPSSPVEEGVLLVGPLTFLRPSASGNVGQQAPACCSDRYMPVSFPSCRGLGPLVQLCRMTSHGQEESQGGTRSAGELVAIGQGH